MSEKILREEIRDLRQLIYTMLRQIDVEKIGDPHVIYSARIIFTEKEYQLMHDIWRNESNHYDDKSIRRRVNTIEALKKENQKLQQELDSLQNEKNLNSIHSHKKIMGLIEENKYLTEQIENGLCPMCGARISKCGGLKNNKK